MDWESFGFLLIYISLIPLIYFFDWLVKNIVLSSFLSGATGAFLLVFGYTAITGRECNIWPIALVIDTFYFAVIAFVLILIMRGIKKWYHNRTDKP